MSGLPGAITTFTVTFGPGVSMQGVDLAMSVSFTPSTSVVWAATGTPVIALVETATAAVGESGSAILPNPDQDGFVDGSGNTIKNWTYTASASYILAGKTVSTASKTFTVSAGTTTVDLDLMLPVATSEGVTVDIPDVWTSQIQEFSSPFIPADIGMAICTNDPVQFVGSLALSAGFMYVSMVRATTPSVITQLAVSVATGPTSPTVAYMGLYDIGTSYMGATATLVAQTADIHTALAASTKNFALTSSYTLIPGHYYYIAIFCDVTFNIYCTSSTTAPQNIRVIAGGVTSTANGTGARALRSNATVSVLPGSFSTSAYTQTSMFWFGAY